MLVNFTDYLDTGLFLDHRITRARLGDGAQGKRFLNLFAYTGTATVHAVGGGARRRPPSTCRSTYLDWALRNLELNGLRGPAARVRAGGLPGLARVADAAHAPAGAST